MGVPAFPSSPSSALAVRPAKVNDFKIYGPSPELSLGDVDSYGVLWLWDNIEGWFETPPFSSVVAPLGNSDFGTWKDRFSRNPKHYTILGKCYAGDKTRAWEARERLMRYWGDPNKVFNLVVDEPTGPKRAEVRLAEPIRAPWTESLGRARGFSFEIPLVARDPLKYSLGVNSDTGTSQGPGSYGLTLPFTFPLMFTANANDPGVTYATVYNEGNENSPPVSIVAGEILRGWRIENVDDGGKTIWIDRSLGAGDILELDHRTGLAKINGSSVDVAVSGEWFSLVPGVNRIRLASPAPSSAIVTVKGSSAWR